MSNSAEIEKLERKTNYALIQSLKNKNVNYAEQISKLVSRVDEIEKYLDAWKEAGFDPEQLKMQISILMRAQALSELIAEVGYLNKSGTYTLTELSFSGQEFGSLCDELNVRPRDLLSIGIFRLQNGLSLNGLIDYNRETSAVKIYISDENGMQFLNLEWKLSSNKLKLPIPYHIIKWEGNQDQVLPTTLLLRFMHVGEVVNTALSYTETNLTTKEVVTKFTNSQQISIGAVADISVDLPMGMTLTCTAVPNWKDPGLEMMDMYIEDYSVDELFYTYREYITDLISNMGSDTLASAYGQGAIAALSSSSSILSSTIIQMKAQYVLDPELTTTFAVEERV